MQDSLDQDGTVFYARPGRRVVVAPDLNELRGPIHGNIELPQRIVWQGSIQFNLDHPDLLRCVYETVLREARTVKDLQTWLDGPTLIRVWPELFLPAGVRQAWQKHHPQLARRAA
jgi:hypothetical protein